VVESIIVADLLEPPHQSAADPAAEAPAPPVEEKPLPDTTVQENAAKEHASAPGRIHGNAWLLAQSGEQYTVQIMALRSEEVLRQIVARVPDSSPFAIYAFQRESGTMFALTHGLYPTRSAALAASEALPRELGKVKPWVRKLRAIHAEIRQTRTP
jgi:DamX protein